MRQTSFLPDVAPPTTRELIDKLARGNAMPKPQEPCDFGLFGERQLDICDLIQAPRYDNTPDVSSPALPSLAAPAFVCLELSSGPATKSGISRQSSTL